MAVSKPSTLFFKTLGTSGTVLGKCMLNGLKCWEARRDPLNNGYLMLKHCLTFVSMVGTFSHDLEVMLDCFTRTGLAFSGMYIQCGSRE